MFKGTYTALITPFLSNGQIDKASLYQLIDQQIAAKVDGLVILGTTGESPTISSDEHDELLELTVKHIDGRCKMIAGTGSNCTRTAIYRSNLAETMGVDGLLLVNPYYNKPTQKGLYEHFKAIADSVNIPIILYNIEGRSGVNLETDTLLKLADHPQIVSVKEASGNLDQMKDVINRVPEGFTVLSGDDGLTLDLIRMGGHGVVSVLSNILPAEMQALVTACREDNMKKAQTMHDSMSSLFDVCFIETNPQPIKTLLAHEGQCEEVFRLPLTTMEEENRVKLIEVWETWKVNADTIV